MLYIGIDLGTSAVKLLLMDEEGKEYLDFMAGIAVNSTGHCNKRVVEAIMEQCQTMMHASNYCYTVPQGMLAELICKSIGMEKIYFQNSGAEANEAMIKLARKYGKDNFIIEQIDQAQTQNELNKKEQELENEIERLKKQLEELKSQVGENKQLKKVHQDCAHSQTYQDLEPTNQPIQQLREEKSE